MTSNLRRGARAIGMAILLAAGGIVAVAIASLLAVFAIRATGLTLSPVVEYGFVFITSGVTFVLVGLAYLRYRDLSIEYVTIEVPSLRGLLWAGAGYVSAFALVILSALVLTATNTNPNTSNQAAQAGIENPELLLWLVPLSLFVIAPAEEFLYRGVIQSRLRETFIPAIAIPVTAALFAAVHFFSLTGGAGGRVIAISILFFPSLVFGYVYEKTGNLVVNTIVHGVYNSTLVLLLYITLQFADLDPSAGVGLL